VHEPTLIIHRAYLKYGFDLKVLIDSEPKRRNAQTLEERLDEEL
jgi:hypothetical protein